MGKATPAGRRRWVAKMRAEGRCVKCASPEDVEHDRCYRCRFKFLEYQRNYYRTVRKVRTV